MLSRIMDKVRLIPLEAFGIKMISIGLLVDDNAPIIWRGPMASGAIKQFMTDVDWGELDYLVFDMPPGTGDIQLTLVQTIPLNRSSYCYNSSGSFFNRCKKSIKDV